MGLTRSWSLSARARFHRSLHYPDAAHLREAARHVSRPAGRHYRQCLTQARANSGSSSTARSNETHRQGLLKVLRDALQRHQLPPTQSRRCTPPGFPLGGPNSLIRCSSSGESVCLQGLRDGLPEISLSGSRTGCPPSARGQRFLPTGVHRSAASISWTLIRTVLPARCTAPSITVATPSSWQRLPGWFSRCRRTGPPKCVEMTFSEPMRARLVSRSSWMPSVK